MRRGSGQWVWSAVLLWGIADLMGVAFCLRLSAFNIQIFGRSKVGKADVMSVLTKILIRYDIVLIQEIRDISGTAIVQLLQEVNSLASPVEYNMTISARLGSSSSKEEYCYFYRNDKVSVVQEATYDEQGNDALFEREPFMVKFQAAVQDLDTFVLGGVHIKPSNAVAELVALRQVFEQAKTVFGTDDVMIMGDMNADCSYVPNRDWVSITLKDDPAFHWLIADAVDTTVSATDCAYDRFILTGSKFLAAIVPGSAKPFLYDAEYNLTSSLALDISDHYPIEVELRDRQTDRPTDRPTTDRPTDRPTTDRPTTDRPTDRPTDSSPNLTNSHGGHSPGLVSTPALWSVMLPLQWLLATRNRV